MSSHGDETQRVRQAASAWCHDGGQTAVFTVVRSGSLTTAFVFDLRKWTTADDRGSPPAALAVWKSGSLDYVPGDAVFDTAHAAAATGDDVSGDDQRPSRQLWAAGPCRAL